MTTFSYAYEPRTMRYCRNWTSVTAGKHVFAHGMLCGAPWKIEDVTIEGYDGNGIHMGDGSRDKIEKLARAMCEGAGLDPDETYSHAAEPSPDGSIHDVLLHSPNWTRFAREADIWIFRSSRRQNVMDLLDEIKDHLAVRGRLSIPNLETCARYLDEIADHDRGQSSRERYMVEEALRVIADTIRIFDRRKDEPGEAA